MEVTARDTGGKMLITKLLEVRRTASQAQGNSGISGAGGQVCLLQIIYCPQTYTKEVWGPYWFFFLVYFI